MLRFVYAAELLFNGAKKRKKEEAVYLPDLLLRAKETNTQWRQKLSLSVAPRDPFVDSSEKPMLSSKTTSKFLLLF